jgi:hypothetical protein
MNSHRTKSFTTIVFALIGTSILTPSFSSATAEPVWDDGTIVTHDDGAHWENGGGEVKSIVCSSAGNCTAVGEFTNPFTYQQAFTMSSVNGVWSRARPTTFADGIRNPSGESELLSVSCASAGNCAAVGTYSDADFRTQPFITQSSNRTWTDAARVAFLAGAQNAALDAELVSVSCPSVGSCTAVGHYASSDDSTKPLVVTSTTGAYRGYAVSSDGGVWSTAHTLGPGSELVSVSCTSAGNCTAVGNGNSGGRTYAIRITSVDGVWGQTQEVSFPAVGTELGNDEIFVMSSNEAPPATTTLPATTVPSSGTVAPTTTLAPPALDTVRALPPAPTPIVADNSIATGEAITVSFGGFTPFEYVQLVVASTPQVIGSGYANAQGVVTLTGNLPTNLTSGTHTLAVYAPGSGIGFTQPITVTALTLPTTGSSRGDGGAQVALWVLLAGIGAIVVARRHNA